MSTTVTAEPITANNILALFPDVDTTLVRDLDAVRAAESSGDHDLAGYDEEQIRLMGERCIVLDNNDNPIGSASKKTCAHTK